MSDIKQYYGSIGFHLHVYLERLNMEMLIMHKGQRAYMRVPHSSPWRKV